MRIRFEGVSIVPRDELERRKPILQQYPPPPMATCDQLAVVGGGPSALQHINEIASFEAVWAINGTWRWCEENGIDAALFTIDPLFIDAAPIGIYADICDPPTVAASEFAHVFKVDGLARGTTSATACPHLAIQLGYRHVTFFGCEGSFAGQTHTFKNIGGARLWIMANGREWETNPQMFMQCEVLAEIIRMAPNVFCEKSGGLLGAMIADPDIDMVAGTAGIHKALNED